MAKANGKSTPATLVAPPVSDPGAVTLTVPLIPHESYPNREARFDLSLHGASAKVMHDLAATLRERHATIGEDGPHVENVAGAFRWLAHELARCAELSRAPSESNQ